MKKMFAGQVTRIKVLLFTVLIAMGSVASVSGQDENKPAKVRLGLSYKKVDDERQIIASVKTKVDKTYEAVPDVDIKFYHDEIAEGTELGMAVTNEKGEALLVLPESADTLKNADDLFTFHAVLEGNPGFRDSDKDLEVKDAVFNMNLEVADSVKVINIFLGVTDSGQVAGVHDANIKFYVQRLFGRLPIGEGFEVTDKRGNLSLEFPEDIRGNTAGEVTIIATLQDDDNYGTLIRSEKIGWGIPIISDSFLAKRELWSARSNVPLYLLIVVNTMLIGIWGVIIYIIYQLTFIKKIAKRSVF